MKNVAIKLSALALFMGLTAAANAASPVVGDGGTVNFNGMVVETACTVDVNSTNQNIDLGQVKLSDMATAGAMSSKTPFSIQLDDCSVATATSASFGFLGQADSTDASSLANIDAGASAATNVGVQMTDIGGQVVPVDGSFDTTSKMTLTNGTNTADFSAYMIATAAGATAGSLHSTVDFKVQYE